MTSEFINNRVDISHALIDEGEYIAAVEILKNLKLRIHEDTIEEEIKTFEAEHDNTLSERVSGIDAANEDQLLKDSKKLEQYRKYAKAYLKFYHRLSKEYDI